MTVVDESVSELVAWRSDKSIIVTGRVDDVGLMDQAAAYV